MLRSLLTELEQATGNDAALDRSIARAFAAAEAAYTASTEPCLALLNRALPGWHWHVGWAGNGVFPYARIDKEGQRVRVEAPTVPLALLRAIVRAGLGDLDPPAPTPPRPVWQR